MFLNKTQRILKALKQYFKKSTGTDLKSTNVEDLISEASNLITPAPHLYRHNIILSLRKDNEGIHVANTGDVLEVTSSDCSYNAYFSYIDNSPEEVVDYDCFIQTHDIHGYIFVIYNGHRYEGSVALAPTNDPGDTGYFLIIGVASLDNGSSQLYISHDTDNSSSSVEVKDTVIQIF